MSDLTKIGANNSKPILNMTNGDQETEGLKTIERRKVDIKDRNGVIPKADVERVILNAIVLLKPECQLLDVPSGEHHHVHVGRWPMDHKVFYKEEHTCASLDIYKDDLGKKIRESSCFAEHAVRICVLQQIASGVEHLHRLGRPHGNLAEECVFLSCDDRNHPVILEPHEPIVQSSHDDNVDKRKADDINDLGRLFYLVLTNGEDLIESKTATPGLDGEKLKIPDCGTAKDLLDKMLNVDAPITIQEVLQHPLFWTDDEKIKFIINNFDSISHNRDIIKKLEKDAKIRVFKREWKTKLQLTFKEKDELKRLTKNVPVYKDKIFQMAGGAKTKKKKNLTFTVYLFDGEKLTKVINIEGQKWKKLTDNIPIVNICSSEPATPSGVIHNLLIPIYENIQKSDYEISGRLVLVKKEEDGGYDKECFYDLMRFLRNKKVHFWEADSQAKDSFKAAGGFWNFFCSRFPNLLEFVYNHRTYFPYCKRVTVPREQELLQRTNDPC